MEPFVQLSCANLFYFFGYFQQQKYSVFASIPPDKKLGSVWWRIFVKTTTSCQSPQDTSIASSFSTCQLLGIKLSSDVTDNENPKCISHSLPKEQLHLLKHSEPSSLTNQRVHPDAFQITVVIWHQDIWGGKRDVIFQQELFRKSIRVKDKKDTYVKPENYFSRQ